MQKFQKARIDMQRKLYGDKPCEHGGEFGKEYDFGGDTGDVVCLTCWQVFSPSEYTQLFKKDANREK